jgi:Na+-transporting methylmalonyl-CoA/oxaloacetate decarboxylase gamma subunit
MSDAELTYWTVVLILGAVVIVAVVALLSLLVYFVKIIDRRVAEVRDTLAEVSQNTASAALIPQTAERVDAVLAEGLQHHLFLGRVAGATRENQ